MQPLQNHPMLAESRLPSVTWTEYPPPQDLPPVQIGDPALPLISIVTPSFNQGTFISETIESVLHQPYPNIEYWVIDGGSTDETLDVLRRYEHDPRFHWLSEPDRGQSDAINKGWSRCRGDILAWLNSDDYYEPDIFSAVVKEFCTHSSLGLVYGEVRTVTSTGQLVRTMGYRVTPEQMLTELIAPFQATTFFHHAAVQLAGPIDLSLHYGMDADFLLRLMANVPYRFLPRVIANYRLHQTSKTVTAKSKFVYEKLTVLEKILAHRNQYPAFLPYSEAELRSKFYRLASKMLYTEGAMTESLFYLDRAVRVYPASWKTIAQHDVPRWLMRWLLPSALYEQLIALMYRGRRAMRLAKTRLRSLSSSSV
ncbi:MAG: glycosyltransferase [Chloroflexaceae bacterium]|nr:glycosyltransferase [Chloroflexaceae bacterium]